MKNTIFIFFVFYGLNLSAQRFDFKVYSIDEGLPQSEVFSIFQDSRGSLWVGTNGGGLARFNGKTFEVFSIKEGLPNAQVNHVTEDSKGNLWAVSFGGVSKFDGKKFTNYALENSTLQINVGRIWESKEGKIWLYVFHSAQNQKIYVLEDSIFKDLGTRFAEIAEGNIIAPACQNTNKTLFISTKNGLFEYDGQSVKRSKLNDLPEFIGRNIAPRILTKDGRLLIVSFLPNNPAKLYFYKNEELSEIENPQGRGIAQSLTQDKYGRIWFSLGNQLYWIEPNGKKVNAQNLDQTFNTTQISALHADSEGNIWVGTRGYGILRLSSMRFVFYAAQSGLRNVIVRSFFQDSKGNMWIGSLGTVTRLGFDGKVANFSIPDPPNFSSRITQIGEIDGKIWVGADLGLCEFDGEKMVNINTKMGLPPNAGVNVFVQDADTTWFVSNRNAMFKKTPQGVETFNSPKDFVDNSFHHLYKAGNGDIWATTENGIIRYKNGKFESFSKKNGLKNDLILQCTEDSWGRIWLTTYGAGIYIFDGKTFENISTQNSRLASDLVYSILRDTEGNMWAGTQSGLDKISLDKEGKIIKMRNYGKYEGFTVPECNGRAIYLDKEKNIWVGTIQGAFRYDPQEDRPNPVSPATQISGIRLFFRPINWQKPEYQSFYKSFEAWDRLPNSLVLPYDSNHVSFDFEANSFQTPEKVLFQWKLEGIDKDWLPPSSKTEASYPNLPAGNYTFKLRAANNEGVWNEKPVEFSFRIDPPLWETWWFRSGALFGFFGIVFSGFKWRIRMIKAKQEELERLVREKTTEVVLQKNQILEKNAELQQTQEEIIAQHDFINHQNKELQKKNKDIIDSINYAKRIQEAMLPQMEQIRKVLPDSFILFRPRDIVSGDFYWFSVMSKNSNNNKKLVADSCDIDEFNTDSCKAFLAVADCTGHGVPGAFMSMIGEAYLNQIIETQEVSEPAQVLNLLHQNIRKALRQEQSSNHDGMEIGLCVIDFSARRLTFAGAKSPLLMIRNGEFTQIKGNRKSIGGNLIESKEDFEQKIIELSAEPTMFYLSTDGYRDQIGGFQRRKFLSLRFHELLVEIHQESVEKQYSILLEKLEEWKSGNRQIDDILLMGFRL